MNTRTVEEKRTALRTWLVQSGMSRTELAEKLGVTLASVNNWLSCTNIPEKRWGDIKSIFAQDSEQVRNRVVGTSLSDEEMAFFEKAAEKLGISKEELFRHFILKHLREELE